MWLKKKSVIVYTVGVWDMFHIGHLNLLKKAKSFGDILIVGVNTDELTREYKGRSPVINWQQRAEIVEACRYVDMVIKTDSLEKDDLLKKLQVDILVHGDDKNIRGQEFMKKNKRKVIYLPYTPEESSRKLSNKISGCRPGKFVG